VQSELLYESVASDFKGLIDAGALRAGDRLPSVRRASRDRGVSVATMLAAYLRLENQGLVEVRPKSGHFVRRREREAPPLRTPRLSVSPARVSVSSGVAALVQSMRDPAVVPLGSAYAAPELLPIRALNRTLASIAREASTVGAAYDAPPGLATLRRQLAKRAVSWGLKAHEDDFVTTIGATEALHLALRATTRPGDSVAVETPSYFGLLQLIEDLGLRAIEVPADPTTGMDLDALDEAVERAPVRAILATPNFNNPLGARMPDEAKARLVHIAARADVPIIEDDVYGELAFDGTRPRPAKAFDRDGRVILCGSVSKTLAPGYRVGWVVPGRYQASVERLKFAQSLATPTVLQMAVAEYLDRGGYDRHLRTLRARFAAQVQRFREEVLATFPEGTRTSAPQGGFVLWVELPAEVDAFSLQADALRAGIAIAPGPVFSARQRFASCIRLSCGFPWSARIQAAIEHVGELARAAIRARRG
jgi:DNA-binding transcriptional MocR family regulator